MFISCYSIIFSFMQLRSKGFLAHDEATEVDDEDSGERISDVKTKSQINLSYRSSKNESGRSDKSNGGLFETQVGEDK